MKKLYSLLFALAILILGTLCVHASEINIVRHTEDTLYVNSDSEYNAVAVVSSYENGRLKDVNMKPVTLNAGSNVIKDLGVYTNTVDTVKAILFESGDSLKPLCPVLIQSINKDVYAVMQTTTVMDGGTGKAVSRLTCYGNNTTYYFYATDKDLKLSHLTNGSIVRFVFKNVGNQLKFDAVYVVDTEKIPCSVPDSYPNGLFLAGGEVTAKSGKTFTLKNSLTGETMTYTVGSDFSNYSLITRMYNDRISASPGSSSDIWKNYYDKNGNIYSVDMYDNFIVLLQTFNGELKQIFILMNFLGH